MPLAKINIVLGAANIALFLHTGSGLSLIIGVIVTIIGIRGLQGK